MCEIDRNTLQTDQGIWNECAAKLNVGRFAAAMAVYDNKLFICGGRSVDRSYLTSVEMFEPSVGAWQIKEGTETEIFPLFFLIFLFLTFHSLLFAGQMTKARAFHSLIVFDDELFAVGGDHGTTTIEKRNKRTKQWQLITDLGEID